MKAKITGESDERVGLHVHDNRDKLHRIEMEFDGNIRYHQTEHYPDEAANRTRQEENYLLAARRYSKWYVYRQRGYDTIPARENPDRVTLVALVLSEMDTENFQQIFADFYRQLRCSSTGEDPVVPIPEVDDDEALVYQQDIYLGLSFDALLGYVKGISVDDPVGILEDLFESQPDSTASLFDHLKMSAQIGQDHGLEDAEADLPPEEWIEAVSGIHRYWGNLYHEEHRLADQPDVDRDPDARLEILDFVPDSLDDFREQVIRNLRCQIRDCYIRMAKNPPENVRLRGPGIHQYTLWYQYDNEYQDYWNPEAEIDWEIEPTSHLEDRSDNQ